MTSREANEVQDVINQLAGSATIPGKAILIIRQLIGRIQDLEKDLADERGKPKVEAKELVKEVVSAEHG